MAGLLGIGLICLAVLILLILGGRARATGLLIAVSLLLLAGGFVLLVRALGGGE